MGAINAPLAAGLLAVAAGSVAYVVLMPWLAGEKRAQKRMAALGGSTRTVVDRNGGVNRRDQVAKSLKDLDAKANSKKVTLELKIERSGLGWSTKVFYIVSAVLAVALGLMVLFVSASPLIAVCAAFAGGFGFPRWFLGYMAKRRIKRFCDELPNAVDVVVRGIRSGIPLGDCLRMISREAEEPLRGEFKAVVDAQALGLSLGDAVSRLYDRVPVSDVNFFAIVINIQEKSGGNLSEALTNLSRVLRDRKKMAGKVQAMSMEAKASGGIIAVLPFAVGIMTYLSSPDYISLLWTTSIGKFALLVSAFWMMIGIFTMKKMISFDV